MFDIFDQNVIDHIRATVYKDLPAGMPASIIHGKLAAIFREKADEAKALYKAEKWWHFKERNKLHRIVNTLELFADLHTRRVQTGDKQ